MLPRIPWGQVIPQAQDIVVCTYNLNARYAEDLFRSREDKGDSIIIVNEQFVKDALPISYELPWVEIVTLKDVHAKFLLADDKGWIGSSNLVLGEWYEVATEVDAKDLRKFSRKLLDMGCFVSKGYL